MNKKCQVFTPREVVEAMLDKIGYKEGVYGKKVLENSCGVGNILCVVVERYIKICLVEGYSNISIKKGLELDIYGVEIDKIHFNKCIENLNHIAEKYGLYNIDWKILNIDSLNKKWEVKFDYLIGNPPYIKYSEINSSIRKFVKENFKTCSIGKFDYCYAFIESALENLNDTGKMIYLIPNSIFKNVFGKNLRAMMLDDLTEIIDYKNLKIFPGVSTSSALILIEKGRKTEKIIYQDVKRNFTSELSKKSLGEKWIFREEKGEEKASTNKFGDFFNASISIATLLNEAYVVKEFEDNGEYIVTKSYNIEKEVIKRAMSPKSMSYGKTEMIIFPYYYRLGELKRYTLREFEEKFPQAVKYLKQFENKLQKRKSSENTEWFEYGRTQALKNLNQSKLLLSTVVTSKIKVYELNEESIPYSGIFITPKSSLSLNIAKRILTSEDFLNYAKGIGIQANGESVRITVNDINNFHIDLEGLIRNGENEI